ncbi:hypothetical protein [Sphingomonas sp. SUN039]|uniref:hypothetical protein n=1 Tax=Sphingomonas sp. SUN039 TaxID=2937787 RepID=UPI002164508F|nr:hypothetical protein [Sphingomonas sp. SUN039]UVO52928.1 hypothetical protein M0209_01870 [Sphingomonas sp. SUN039]
MQFLKTIFWVIIAVIVVYFAWANPQVVQVNLWSGLAWFPPMWFAMLTSFLAGLVPMALLYRATRWTLRRRLDSANRALTDTAPLVPMREMAPPGAAPIAPPPGAA